jgi:hypothetical protein
VNGSRDEIWSRPHHIWNSDGVHPFCGGHKEFEDMRSMPCEQSTWIIVFFPIFMKVSQLLVAEINE